MTAVLGVVSAEFSGESADLKLRKAGMQFEAILLNKVLGDLEHAFTSLPGKKEDHATEAYGGFAMQALASGLAEAGGIGIGAIIAKALAGQAKTSASAGVTTHEHGPQMVKAF